MPKDDWKRANDRARYGPGGTAKKPNYAFRRKKKKRSHPKVKAGTFVVPVGVACAVSLGGGPWVTYTTRVETVFDRYEPTDNGGRWLFRKGDWALKICPVNVRR